ncbi:related to methyltransferase [Cephalotrichum gorgonifer]|uniref:Related to methyltransferase n=1 Tax=Cephalotrichum gorgonifer TaxID=2041049 RepID=A0AAE8SV43_9PEZI|nr:related to methyltransferase [Cephalotrichum gorgonifer]
MSKDLVPDGRAGSPPTYFENGREYGRKYEYIFPCDQLELDNLGILHNTITIAMGEDRKLYSAPVYFRHRDESTGPNTNGAPRGPAGRQVLDLGTGSGLEYPEAQVFAVDFFDFQQPRQIFSNTWFSGHIDIEKPWTSLHSFVRWAVDRRRGEGVPDFDLSPNNWDLIYARMLNGSIRDRPQLHQRILEHLKPGFGYAEFVEIDWTPRSDDNTLPVDSYFAKWANELLTAMDKAGRSMRINPNMANMLRDQGFVNVKERTIKLHHNPWITGGDDERIGRWFNLALTHGLQGISMAPFTRYLGWSPDEVNKLVAKVRHEICLLKHHGYCTLHIWTAGRPPS